MKAEIWHNPRCSKSRQTLALLEEQGAEVKVVLYLENPPSKSRIEKVLKLLGGEAIQLVRTKEAEWKATGLDKSASKKAIVEALVETPKLIERPVVITDKGAVIGRPPENVLTVL